MLALEYSIMKLFLLFNILTSAYCALVSVRTNEGELVGKTHELENDREVYAFLGVPYADPPTGSNRFKEPQPLTPWDGIRMAISQGNICPQMPYTPGNRLGPVGDEDCLYLNIFTPRLPENNLERQKLMNVFVYIHGGAFMFAAGNEAFPDYLQAKDDIVFVSINYRLGPLGFLTTNGLTVPGNNGLKDQVEALRWIKRNIHHFGGNPSKVTIYGCSAGGASIQYHMISPMSKGLFQRAMSSSGTVLHPWALPPDVVDKSMELVSSLGCGYENDQEMMECLRSKPVEDIVEAGYQYGEEGHLVNLPFGPVIEPHHREAFLSENPHKLLKAGEVKNVPWLIGFVENEGSFIVTEMATNETYMNIINDDWDRMAPKIFSYHHRSKSEQKRMSSLIREKYLKGKPLNSKTLKQMFQAVGDRHISCGGMVATKLQASAIPQGSFCYKLYYRGAESASDYYHQPNSDKKNFGVCHSDDLFYIVKYGDGKSKNKNDSDMSKLLISSILAFMETGNPSTSDIEWNPISKNGVMNCLVIYSYTYQRMEDIENHKNNRFWKKLDACEKSH